MPHIIPLPSSLTCSLAGPPQKVDLVRRCRFAGRKRPEAEVVKEVCERLSVKTVRSDSVSGAQAVPAQQAPPPPRTVMKQYGYAVNHESDRKRERRREVTGPDSLVPAFGSSECPDGKIQPAPQLSWIRSGSSVSAPDRWRSHPRRRLKTDHRTMVPRTQT